MTAADARKQADFTNRSLAWDNQDQVVKNALVKADAGITKNSHRGLYSYVLDLKGLPDLMELFYDQPNEKKYVAAVEAITHELSSSFGFLIDRDYMTIIIGWNDQCFPQD